MTLWPELMMRPRCHDSLEMIEPARSTSKQRPASSRVLTWWFGLMSAAGVAFGAFAEDRPFGDDVLAHPLVVFFIVVAAGLLGLRVALRRPVPEIISDRLLLVGCLVGLAAFLIGNWLAVNLVALR
jgi:hypothetical protein